MLDSITYTVIDDIAEQQYEAEQERANERGYEEWLSVLAGMWEAIGKPVDERRLAMYAMQLTSLPLGLLERSVSRAIMENTYNNVPTVGAIWAATRKELGNPYDIQQGIEQYTARALQVCDFQ